MWYKTLNRMMVLRAPEPADVGGGEAGGVEQLEPVQGEAEAAVEPQAETAEYNPFDFSAEEPEEEEQEVPQAGAEAEEAEYVLDLGKHYTGGDETTQRITAIAKEAGLDAAGFSRAIQGITEMLVEQQAAARAAGLEVLKDAWKGDFDKNMKQVRGVLRAAFAGEELSAERKALLQSADVFRLVHQLAKAGGERGSALGKAAPAMSAAQEAEDMFKNPDNPLHDALLNPAHKNHRYAADKYNKLVGMNIF